jgi:hypothetical protein
VQTGTKCRQTGITGRQADRQAAKKAQQAGKQTGRQANKQTDRQTGLADRHDRKASRQTGRQPRQAGLLALRHLNFNKKFVNIF